MLISTTIIFNLFNPPHSTPTVYPPPLGADASRDYTIPNFTAQGIEWESNPDHQSVSNNDINSAK